MIPVFGRHEGRASIRSSPARVWLPLAPALGVVLGLFGGGLALGGLQSLGYLPAAGMTALSLDAYRQILTDPDFIGSLWLTFYISGVSTVIAAGLSIVAALALIRGPGTRRLLHLVFQAPLMVPHLVIAVSIILLLSPAGMISRLMVALGITESSAAFPLLVNDPACVGIIVTYVWKEVPFITLMFLAVLRHTGAELLEVGRTLKAGRWQRFRFILLPTLAPALGGASLFVFAYTFGAFEVPFLLGRTYPMTLPVRAYRLYRDVDLMARPEGIATGIVIAVIVAGLVALTFWGVRWVHRRRGVL